jgi:hypothetical protein
MRMMRIALTISANNVPGKCAVWNAHRDGSWPVFGTQNACSPQTHAAFEMPVLSADERTAAVVFRNWSDTDMRTPYLRAYYREPRSRGGLLR